MYVSYVHVYTYQVYRCTDSMLFFISYRFELRATYKCIAAVMSSNTAQWHCCRSSCSCLLLLL